MHILKLNQSRSRECLGWRLPQLAAYLRYQGFAEHVADQAALRAVMVGERYLADGRADRLSHPWAWLKRVAFNAARRLATKDVKLALAGPAWLAEVPNPLDLARIPGLTEAVERLSPQQQWAVELRYYQRMGQLECACVMGISIGAFRTHLNRGVKNLRGMLSRKPTRQKNRRDL